MNITNNTATTVTTANDTNLAAEGTVIDSKVLATMSVEDMLNIDVNMVEAVSDFSPLPSGLYSISVESVGLEEVGAENKPVIAVEYQINGVVELNDDSEADQVGDLPRKHTENYFLQGGKTAYGLRSFVTIFKPLAGDQAALVTDLMEMAIGATGEAVLERKTRKNKNTGELNTNTNINANAVMWH